MVPRPAVVLTPRPIGPDELLIWTAMITNAQRDHWPGDIPIPDSEALGLIIPSKVRTAKIGAVETQAATRIGRLPSPVWIEVQAAVLSYLGH